MAVSLSTLLAQTTVLRVSGNPEIPVLSLAADSRRVRPGALFVALRGEKSDGNAHIPQAVENGAVAIVTDRPEIAHPKAAVALVPAARPALADLACAFHGHPSRSLKTAAVTGTNGKTTFTFLLKHLLGKGRMPAGLIGTVRYEIGDRILPAPRTTPEANDLQEMLAGIAAAGCRAAVLEASSHALALDRVRGTEFDAAVFTNLTQDHLDFHGTMEAYFEAKALLFTGLAAQKHKRATAIINLDDRFGQRLVDRVAKSVATATYGLGARADFRASSPRIDFSGTTYQLEARGRSYLVRLPLIGRFNVYNSLAALAAACSLGVNIRDAVAGLADAPSAPGRLELVHAPAPFKVFVDYAHTPDALVNVMKTLRELSPARLIVVFGCGGNRDKAKRPLMAAAVEDAADIAIITSDNPRKENPADILRDIESGFRSKPFETIEDRAEAIARAISIARPRDIVLIAGKGHETYQEFADTTLPFDDLDVARQAILSLAKEEPTP